MQGQQQAQLRSIGDVLVLVNAPGQRCPKCKVTMHVRKTFEHAGATLVHGPFRVRETEYICPRGCTERAADGHGRRPLVRRPAQMASLLLPRSVSGYDVMAHVGIQRFIHFRQREEIRQGLALRWGVELSAGQVSELAQKFCAYLKALHLARAKPLREALASDGGWPLHVDATGEDGQGTLLAAYAGWRGWALGAWKISTERADAILPRLHEVEALFGAPCAIMRDLGKAVIEATQDFVGNREIPILSCHLHFVKDVGKDLLREAHDQLRDLFRRFKVLPRLRTLARDLGRSLGADIERARCAVADWVVGADERFRMPDGPDGLAVVRALAQWVLAFADEGTDAGFPFDRPQLDLYRRSLWACRAAESLLHKPWHDPRVHATLQRLHAVLEPVRSELPFQRPARVLEARSGLFDELRAALRLQAKLAPTFAACATSVQEQRDEIRDVRRAVRAFRSSIEKRRPERGPAQDMRQAIDLVLEHLDRHGSSLWGHVIALPRQAGRGIRLVERTNVILESFWHEIKHGERRRSGRKILTQDFERLPAAAVLARNLTKPDYVQILCGTLDELPKAFAELDASNRDKSLPARLRASASAAETDIVSSSLPRADRNLVRMDAMSVLVLAEAGSRAPRLLPRRRTLQATVV